MIKLRKPLLVFLLISFFSFVVTDNLLLDSVKKEIEKLAMKMPDKAYDYIKNVQASTNLVIDSVTRKDLGLLATKYKLPKNVTEILESLAMLKKTTVQSFSFSIGSNSASLKEYVGAGYYSDGMVKFAYMHIKVHGNLVPKYNQVSYKSCSSFLFIKKCKTKTRNVQRGYNSLETNYMKQALRAYGYNYLKAKTLNVKADAQLILTEDLQIYSLNNTKKVMVLEDGRVFIGNSTFRDQANYRRDPSPTSVVEYARSGRFGGGRGSSFGRRNPTTGSFGGGRRTSGGGSSGARTAGSFGGRTSGGSSGGRTSGGSSGGRTSGGSSGGRTSGGSSGGTSGGGSFGRRDPVQKPEDFGILLGSSQSTSDGPFNLELKLNGNLAVTNKNDKIIWQSNTANKGTAPFTLSVTEDGGLVETDKHWKPLFDSTNRCNGYSVCLLQDYKYYSSNGQYYVSIQQEGDIILYQERKGYPEDKIIWNTDEPTEEPGPFTLIVDNQGLIKVIGSNKAVVWAETDKQKIKEGTPGPFKLKVTDDGFLHVLNGRDEIIWKNQ